MTTTTPTPTYQAVKDAAIKTWHLGSDQKGHVTYCGVELMWPDDPRRFSQKVSRDDRHHDIGASLDLVTCKACKRTKEYGYATGTAERPATTTGTRRRTRAAAPRRTTRATEAAIAEAEATGTPASAEATAAVDPAEQVDGSAPRRRAARKSKATRAAERTAAEAARRAETTERADAALAAIDTALQDVAPE